MNDEELAKKAKDLVYRIRAESERLRLAKIETQKIYNQKMKDIEFALSQLKFKCPHITTKYYPDASGNNDSYTKCEDCGGSI